MQYDFSFQNPTRIHFGKTALEHLGPEVSLFGDRVLLVRGMDSSLRTRLHAQVMKTLEQAGKRVWELSGVTSNPTASKVYEGIELARKFSPHLILAMGGGSVIDCAKAIAGGAMTREDFWQTFFVDKREPEDALPLGVILTMTGTGSEMNGNAVITNTQLRQKSGMWSGLLYPVFSLLKPELTYTVPKEQMVSGICDILSHIMEIYMSPSDKDNISDDLAEALMKSVIRASYQSVENPKDYTARSNLMWSATVALNGLLDPSKRGDWMVHQIEHQIGAYTACPHGLGLAAISGAYYRLVAPRATDRFYRFAVNVWGVDPAGKSREEVALLGIDALLNFFRHIGAPTNLRELELSDTLPLDDIADSVRRFQSGYVTLTPNQIRKILRDSF